MWSGKQIFIPSSGSYVVHATYEDDQYYMAQMATHEIYIPKEHVYEITGDQLGFDQTKVHTIKYLHFKLLDIDDYRKLFPKIKLEIIDDNLYINGERLCEWKRDEGLKMVNTHPFYNGIHCWTELNAIMTEHIIYHLLGNFPETISKEMYKMSRYAL